MMAENNHEVFENILKKHRLMEAGDSEHEKIRPALVIAGGGMSGVFGAGVLRSMGLLGLLKAIDIVVASSSGVADAAYLLSNQGHLGISIYFDDLLKYPFINFHRRTVMDVDYLEHVMRDIKELNVSKIRESRTRFYATLMDANNGQGELYCINNASDIVAAIKASMAVPGLYNRRVSLDGKEYVDGSFALPLPVEETISRFDPTDVLVILNQPYDLRLGYGWGERLLGRFFMSNFSRRFKNRVFESAKLYNQEIEKLKNGYFKNVGIAVIAPQKNYVGQLSRNRHAFEKAIHNASRLALDSFGVSENINYYLDRIHDFSVFGSK